MAMQADDVFSHVCENVYETRVRECLCVCERERSEIETGDMYYDVYTGSCRRRPR